MGFIGKLAKKYAVTSKAKVKKNPKEYNNFSTFSEKVGIIDDVKVLKKIGAPVSISSFEGSEGSVFWSADSQSAKALSNFVKKNPKYHVVTEVDSDEDEDEEGNRIYIHVNNMAIVNRLRYLLASGDKDEDLTCVDTDSFS